MTTRLKPRHRQILFALGRLGGTANQQAIAKEVQLSTNGVSQSLGSMSGVRVECLDRRSRVPVWKLIDRIGIDVATLVQHDHGALRDGPCRACEAEEQRGGVSITCPVCGGDGKPVRDGDINCFRCGGNHSLVRTVRGANTPQSA